MRPELPLVSVIIPTYNRSKLLRVALERALGQTYKCLHKKINKNADCST
jgi:glycosyltransferase involved in cell wall biosynthesis